MTPARVLRRAHERRRLFGLVALRSDLRLPGVRAGARGEVLSDDGHRLAADRRLLRGSDHPLARSSAATWPRSTPASASSSRRFRRLRAPALPLLLRGPKREQDWKSYAQEPDLLLARRLDHPLPRPAHADDPAVEQLRRRRVPLRPVGRHVQHRLVVHDQHQLAVLRRRDDDDLLQPDGWADRAELRSRPPSASSSRSR